MSRLKSRKRKPTANERVRRSIAALEKSGGARQCFRLSPKGNSALKAIQAAGNGRTATKIINDLLVDRAMQLGPCDD